MAHHRLRKSGCYAAEATGARRTLLDSDPPGFGMRIGQTGAQTWMVKYCVNGNSCNSPGK
jgi:hypothetical protein